ncbi:MAG: hypothetical protein NC433_13580 [Clostridiales bacterium]|nr:hypothetical protein [Clostridiales bacterium]
MREEERLIGKQAGKQESELNKAKEVSRSFYELGVDIEKIAQGVGYNVETVKGWIDIE